MKTIYIRENLQNNKKRKRILLLFYYSKPVKELDTAGFDGIFIDFGQNAIVYKSETKYL